MNEFEQEGLLDDEHAVSNVQPIPTLKVKETANWTRILAVSGLVLNVLSLLYSFYLLFNQMGFSRYRRYIGNELMVSAVFTIVGLVINICFCFLLYQYSSHLRRLIQAPTSQKLSDFFERQKVFWMVLGIPVLGIVIFIIGALFVEVILMRWLGLFV